MLPYCQTPTECWRIGLNGETDRVDDDSARTDLGKLKEVFASLHATVEGLNPGFKQDLSQIKAPDSLVNHAPARY